MDTIFLIVGPSGSGKTGLMYEMSSKYGYTPVISYTTRPRRHENEAGHFFVTKDEFREIVKNKDMCAYTVFNGHEYGVTSDMVNENDLYVIDPAGVQYFKDHYSGPKKFIVIALKTSMLNRFSRMLKRGDSIVDAFKRIMHDRKAFKNYLDISDLVLTNDDLDIPSMAAVANYYINLSDHEY